MERVKAPDGWLAALGGASKARIGPYRLEGELGRGGMGVVHRAVHEQTGARVALKTVQVAHVGQLGSLRREVEALRQVAHPAVVRILDQGVDEGRPWYAMELLEGPTLQEWRDQRRAEVQGLAAVDARAPSVGGDPSWRGIGLRIGSDADAFAKTLEREEGREGEPVELAPAEAGPRKVKARRLGDTLRLVRRLCVGLGHVHNQGVVHQDLKPSNIFVQRGDQPVLVDFGLVSRFGGVGREVVEDGSPGSGTPAYMAPEQIAGQPVDARADLYALGCILYELITGSAPFSGQTAHQLLYQHAHVAPRAPSELVEGLPEGLDALVLGLLAKERHRRLGYAEDVLEALSRMGVGPEEGEPSVAPRYVHPPHMVGRQQVRDELLRALAGALLGRGGRALVGGESGVGKTFLAKALASAVRERMAVVSGGGSLGGRGGVQGAGGRALAPAAALVAAPRGPVRGGRRGDDARALAAAGAGLGGL
jgi:serine/threonine protein kinase